MNILHLDCSPRAGSHSRRLSAAVVDRLLAIELRAVVVRRDLGLEPIPHVDAVYATNLVSPQAAGASGATMRLSELLIREVEAADVLVIGSPVNNFTLPSVLKAWIDHVVRIGRTMVRTPAGKVGRLRDRPVIVALAAGAVLVGENANQPDFFTPYLTAALGCIGLRSSRFLSLQGTASLDEGQCEAARNALVAAIDGTWIGRDAPTPDADGIAQVGRRGPPAGSDPAGLG